MTSLARRLRERLFWPSERSMQKLMGRIDSLEHENAQLRDSLKAQESVLFEIRDWMHEIGEESCRVVHEVQRAQIAERSKEDIRFGRSIVIPGRPIWKHEKGFSSICPRRRGILGFCNPL